MVAKLYRIWMGMALSKQDGLCCTFMLLLMIGYRLALISTEEIE
jgi:hypothetical protein